MRIILRRFRGILGTAFVWSIGWSLVGAGISAGTRVLSGATPRITIYLDQMSNAAIAFGATGAIAGIIFAFLLLAAERSTPLKRLKLWRVTLAGAFAGSALPMAVWVLLELPAGIARWDVGRAIPLFSALGALTGAFMLRVARRAREAPALLGGGGAMPESPVRQKELERATT